MYKVVDAMTDSRTMRIFLLLVATYLCSQVLKEFFSERSLNCWNWTRIVGLSAFILSFGLGMSASKRLGDAIRLLRDFNTLGLTERELLEFNERMTMSGRSVQFWSGLLIFTIILGTYVAIHAATVTLMWTQWQDGLEVGGQERLTELGLQTLIAIVAAAWSGVYFGRFAHYGALARFLSNANIALRIKPDHYDGASGLKPIGDFYLYQALVFSVPAIFLGLWWSVIIPLLQEQACPNIINLESWRFAIFFHWIVVMSFFYLGFIRPVLTLRQRILDTKKELIQNQVPSMQAEIDMLRERLWTGHDNDQERIHITNHIDFYSQQVWSIRRMSGWPMDSQTRSRFLSLNAIASVVPPLAKSATSAVIIATTMPDDGGMTYVLRYFFGAVF